LIIPVLFILAVIILHDILSATIWLLRTKKSKRSTYRKWLRKKVKERVGKCRDKNGPILHISSYGTYTFLPRGEKILPYNNDMRPAFIGSSDWRGFLRQYMKSTRFDFSYDVIFKGFTLVAFAICFEL
jgi:hypothetical protein